MATDAYCRGQNVYRFCELIDPANPSYDPRYRDTIKRESKAWPKKAPESYPNIFKQAANLAEAAGRLVSAWWQGKPIGRSADEIARILMICAGCEHYDHAQNRCKKCGCFSKFKSRLQTEHCPLPEPKW